jgi:hypothetical protein
VKIRKLRIAPFDYEVVFDDKLSQTAGALGVCLSDTSIILIDPTSSRMVQVETLLHESLHGIWTQTALDKLYTEEQEEQIIFTLAPRIMGLLLDNEELVQEVTR